MDRRVIVQREPRFELVVPDDARRVLGGELLVKDVRPRAKARARIRLRKHELEQTMARLRVEIRADVRNGEGVEPLSLGGENVADRRGLDFDRRAGEPGL